MRKLVEELECLYSGKLTVDTTGMFCSEEAEFVHDTFQNFSTLKIDDEKKVELAKILVKSQVSMLQYKVRFRISSSSQNSFV